MRLLLTRLICCGLLLARGAVAWAETLPYLFDTLAGAATPGTADGPGSVARFGQLSGIARGPGGEIYVADPGNDAIRRVSPDGFVDTLPVTLNVPRVWGPEKISSYPFTLATDSAGNVYYADSYRRTVRKITPAGAVTTLFQGPSPDCWLTAIAVDSVGNVYFADNREFSAAYVRKITPEGVLSLFAGPPDYAPHDPWGTSRRTITALTVDPDDNLYLAHRLDAGLNINSRGPGVPWLSRIVRLSPAGVAQPVAGGTQDNFSDGPAASAGLADIGGLAWDRNGRLFFIDRATGTIRMLGKDGIVSTVAGRSGAALSTDGVGSEAGFINPTGVVVDLGGTLLVPDFSKLRQGAPASAPVILTQPQSLSVATGGAVQFSVTATATPEATFQWFHDGVPFAGATGRMLNFTGARASDAGEYWVMATNSLGTVTSSKVALVITPASAPTPSPGSGAIGSTAAGGGAPSLVFLAVLAALAVRRLKSV